MSNEETKKYTGSCHCGVVRFEADMSLADAGACNCSFCRRVGWIVKMVPQSSFTLLSKQGAETDYQFGKKTAHHTFCPTCGIHTHSSWGEGDARKIIVNLRCLDGVDADALEVKHWDGASV